MFSRRVLFYIFNFARINPVLIIDVKNCRSKCARLNRRENKTKSTNRDVYKYYTIKTTSYFCTILQTLRVY